MSKINSLILSFLSFITYSDCMKNNEVFLVHKDKSILEKVAFDQLFTVPIEDTVTPEEETIILSPKNKRPIPRIEKPNIDLSAFTEDSDRVWKSKYNEKCAHFKRGSDLDLEKILGNWKVVYYKLPHDIPCFEMEIKLNSYEEKKRHYDMYGNLSDNVDWNLCNLEIKSAPGTAASHRKHFLHGSVHNRGVMDNIIIEEIKDRFGKITPMFHEENPDQWLVIKDLLLMRDCDSGDIVIFTRIPYKPRREDLLDALMIFGEGEAFGNMNCLLRLDL